MVLRPSYRFVHTCGREESSLIARTRHAGVMLSIARSRLALVVQLSFLFLHSIALLLGTIYTRNTPQFYPNNSHNKVGWVVTCIVVVQCIMGVIKLAVSIGRARDRTSDNQAAFLPTTIQALEHHQHEQSATSPESHRYSQDSGHCTASEPSRSQSISSTATFAPEEQQKLLEYDADREDGMGPHTWEQSGLLFHPRVVGVANSLTAILPNRTMRVINAVHNVIDRTILLMGFIAFVSGAAVYGGVFVRPQTRKIVNFTLTGV